MKTLVFKVALLASALVLLGGCATVEQLNEVRAIAESARAAANSVVGAADEALAVAREAQATADAAQATADAAESCCDENTGKIDRMFEKAMRK
ncbi:MAG: Lpp/OprI family alanine-zipper lipoprotein [Gammaproteobacteria bacterium]